MTGDKRDIVYRLKEVCVDWSGEQIVDNSTPRDEIHCGLLREAAAEITRLRTALAASEAKLLNVRQILAGTDVGSLPNDYPIERLALETWNTLQERTLEGLALIGRAEAAEAKLEKAREALTIPASMIGSTDPYAKGYKDACYLVATTLKDIA